MFIDEWFREDFYQQLPLGYHQQFSFGQFFRTHAYYPHENLELWRPVPDATEPTKTIASQFQIRPAGQDAFRRGFPLASPKLETNEEFLVVRAKMRPVVLVMPETPSFGIDNRGYRGRVQRHLCLVGQVFGLVDAKTNRTEFNPSFIDRVRRMEFPQLMFLPSRAGFVEVDSLLRLDELQSVFTPNLSPTQLALGNDVAEILKGQLQFLLTGSGPTSYTELRDGEYGGFLGKAFSRSCAGGAGSCAITLGARRKTTKTEASANAMIHLRKAICCCALVQVICLSSQFPWPQLFGHRATAILQNSLATELYFNGMTAPTTTPVWARSTKDPLVGVL
jgi:hypothetical protein